MPRCVFDVFAVHTLVHYVDGVTFDESTHVADGDVDEARTRFASGPGDMGRDEGVIARQQWVVGSWRLLGQHVSTVGPQTVVL